MGGSFYVVTGSSAMSTADIEGKLSDNLTDGSQLMLLTDLTSFDENGYLMNLNTVFTAYIDETFIGFELDKLSSDQMAIINELTAYTYTAFDESNEQISIYSPAYNGLTDPEFEIQSYDNPYIFSAMLNDSEKIAIQNKFGSETGFSSATNLDATYSAIAGEVYNSYKSRRDIFKKTRGINLSISSFTNISPAFEVRVTASTDSFAISAPTTTGGY
jgi:hypothetical protein